MAQQKVKKSQLAIGALPTFDYARQSLGGNTQIGNIFDRTSTPEPSTGLKIAYSPTLNVSVGFAPLSNSKPWHYKGTTPYNMALVFDTALEALTNVQQVIWAPAPSSRFYVLANTDKIYSSTNGTTFTLAGTLPTSTNNDRYHNLVYCSTLGANGTLVATTSYNIATSTDHGANWTTQTYTYSANTDVFINDLVWASGMSKFIFTGEAYVVGVKEGAIAYYSADGATWTEGTLPVGFTSSTESGLDRMAYSSTVGVNGTLVAGGWKNYTTTQSAAVKSTDGITWTEIAALEFTDGVTYSADGVFWVPDGAGAGSFYYGLDRDPWDKHYVSTDSTTWTLKTKRGNFRSNWSNWYVHDNQLVSTSYRDLAILTGPAFDEWKVYPDNVQSVFSSNLVRDFVCRPNGGFAYALVGSYLYTITLSSTTGSAASYVANLNSIAFFGTDSDRLIAVGNNGTTHIDTSELASGNAHNWIKVAARHGYAIAPSIIAAAVRDSTTDCVMTYDGVSWTIQSATPAGGGWRDIVWAEALGMWCAVGSSGIMTSTDGVTWTQRNANDFLNVVWSADRSEFLAFTTTDTFRSTDGIAWTSIGVGSFSAPLRVSWVSDLEVYVGNNGQQTIIVSDDGVGWDELTTPILDDNLGTHRYPTLPIANPNIHFSCWDSYLHIMYYVKGTQLFVAK